MRFLMVIGWSLAGLLLGGVSTFVGLIVIIRIIRPVPAVDSGEIGAWGDFLALMGSGFGAVIGFVCGVIYGIGRLAERSKVS